MSRLKELIAELCPDGVEYKSLGEIATISRGGNFQKKDFCEVGAPCIHYGQIYTRYGLFADSTFTFISPETAKKQKTAAPNDIVMAVTSENIEDVCKCVAWLGHEEIAVSGHTAIIRHNQNTKYLTYYFHTEMFAAQKKKLVHGTKVMEVTPDTLNSVKVPVPPLPVQTEIVRILDDFTEVTAELTEQLTAELTARKKQYEYYRDKLLTFDVHGGGASDAVWRTLGEVCHLKAGKAISAQDISSEKTSTYSVPCYGGNGLRGFVQAANQQGDKSIIGRQGALCGNVCYATGDYYATEHAVVVTDKGYFNSRFLYHVLVHKDLNQYKTAGAQPGLSVAKLETILVPVPNMTLQNRIAHVLDNFDAICSDLNICLPAEIEARQKQYEYYRDLLLSFDDCSQLVHVEREREREK